MTFFVPYSNDADRIKCALCCLITKSVDNVTPLLVDARERHSLWKEFCSCIFIICNSRMYITFFQVKFKCFALNLGLFVAFLWASMRGKMLVSLLKLTVIMPLVAWVTWVSCWFIAGEQGTKVSSVLGAWTRNLLLPSPDPNRLGYCCPKVIALPNILVPILI